MNSRRKMRWSETGNGAGHSSPHTRRARGGHFISADRIKPAVSTSLMLTDKTGRLSFGMYIPPPPTTIQTFQGRGRASFPDRHVVHPEHLMGVIRSASLVIRSAVFHLTYVHGGWADGPVKHKSFTLINLNPRSRSTTKSEL